MFNLDRQKQICGIANRHESGFVENGKTLDVRTLELVAVPTLEELFAKTVKSLGKAGFSVTRTAPKKANGIIRVYRHDSLEHDSALYWMSGVECFLKTGKGFVSENMATIDYSKYEFRWWFFQDEYAIMQPHFVDYFILIR